MLNFISVKALQTPYFEIHDHKWGPSPNFLNQWSKQLQDNWPLSQIYTYMFH